MTVEDLGAILIVDDEPNLAESLGSMLRNRGFKVEVATSFEDATRMLKDGSIEIGVAVIDIRLPGGNGLDLVKLGRERDPPFSSIVMTGSSRQEHRRQSVVEGVLHYMQKPFEMHDLVETIEEAARETQVLRERLEQRPMARPRSVTPVPEVSSDVSSELTYVRSVANDVGLNRSDTHVMTLAALGRPVSSIARIADVDESTVDEAIKRILRALDAELFEPTPENVRRALEERRRG